MVPGYSRPFVRSGRPTITANSTVRLFTLSPNFSGRLRLCSILYNYNGNASGFAFRFITNIEGLLFLNQSYPEAYETQILPIEADILASQSGFLDIQDLRGLDTPFYWYVSGFYEREPVPDSFFYPGQNAVPFVHTVESPSIAVGASAVVGTFQAPYSNRYTRIYAIGFFGENQLRDTIFDFEGEGMEEYKRISPVEVNFGAGYNAALHPAVAFLRPAAQYRVSAERPAGTISSRTAVTFYGWSE